MGTGYYLVNNVSHQLFWLGKGNWSSIWDDFVTSGSLCDRSFLLELLACDFLHADSAYILWLRDKIIEFVGDNTFVDIEIVDDEGSRFLKFLDNPDYHLWLDRYWDEPEVKEQALKHINSNYGSYAGDIG